VWPGRRRTSGEGTGVYIGRADGGLVKIANAGPRRPPIYEPRWCQRVGDLGSAAPAAVNFDRCRSPSDRIGSGGPAGPLETRWWSGGQTQAKWVDGSESPVTQQRTHLPPVVLGARPRLLLFFRTASGDENRPARVVVDWWWRRRWRTGYGDLQVLSGSFGWTGDVRRLSEVHGIA
jgi:hypothetical protein